MVLQQALRASRPALRQAVRPVGMQLSRSVHTTLPLMNKWDDPVYDEWGADPPGYVDCDKKAHVHKVFRPGNYSPRFVAGGVLFFLGGPAFLIGCMYHHSMTKGGYYPKKEEAE